MCDHPNLWVPKKVAAILAATEKLGRGNTKEPYVHHVPSDTLLGTQLSFRIETETMSRQYWVTSAGFIAIRQPGHVHLVFLNLYECDTLELDNILGELTQLLKQ
jgi:hypothetical protein